MTISAEQVVGEAWTAGWEPPPDLNVWQWADKHRILSGKAAAEPGPWRTERVPYAREPMEKISPQDPATKIVLMWGSQLSKTENGNNWLGYIAHHAPGPALFVMPTLNDLKKNVLQRIDPMIRETPVLSERFAKPASRDAANNMFVKEFNGGMLILSGANSASALASMPIRYLYGDEIDRWPHDVDGEGDPLDLAEQRTVTFRSRKKILLTSTPTLKGFSAIEREFNRSDRRYYFVPCPHCGHMQPLRWKDEDGTPRIRWERDAKGKHLAKTARFLCEECGVLIEERYKTQMLAAGRWQATAPGDGETVGYHLNALYSPFYSWSQMVSDFLKAKNVQEKLKAWTNTKLAETWEDKGLSLNANLLAKRLEKYERAVVPRAAAVLVGTADVQGDRIEAKIVAYGAGEESWLVDYDIFWGDPGSDATVWSRLDEWRRRELNVAGTERTMRIAIFGVDSGDQADAVYDYVQPRQSERVVALKGSDYLSRPGLAMEATAKRSHIRLYRLATVAAKDRLLSRMQLEAAGPGYMHMPEWVPEQYLDQMTSEKKLTKKDPRRGTVSIEYVKTGRNEAFDLEVYALGMLFVLQTFVNPSLYRDLGKLQEMLETGLSLGSGRRVRGVRNPGMNTGQ
ncbi:phage terminase large subunit family protein [Ralstonia insidiosa]|uniref:phage terminase large subunit family protein n=1 Tax=Ralstonia insidiosa TaxID=190721 RepID=UPI00205A3802|nr:phage terminase large subunit family protein [Ralstonia insidiosa]MDE4924357.1 phage terminase large subunit family protein [Ralstonia insidiosa]UNJ99900.1 phage terminase large subunit family protein [Ralstonia insidiosa]